MGSNGYVVTQDRPGGPGGRADAGVATLAPALATT